jgi:hypothetical protein
MKSPRPRHSRTYHPLFPFADDVIAGLIPANGVGTSFVAPASVDHGRLGSASAPFPVVMAMGCVRPEEASPRRRLRRLVLGVALHQNHREPPTDADASRWRLPERRISGQNDILDQSTTTKHPHGRNHPARRPGQRKLCQIFLHKNAWAKGMIMISHKYCPCRHWSSRFPFDAAIRWNEMYVWPTRK